MTSRRIFIGGSGRSGTTILGVVFHTHPDVLFFGEPHVIEDRDGLFDYVAAKTSAERFETAMLERFRERMLKKLTARQFDDAPRVYSEAAIRQLIAQTLSRTADRAAGARAFLDGLFGLGLAAWGKRHWVEKTPLTILRVDEIYNLYPELRYLHIIREPKSVCASVLRKPWGASNADEFIAFYRRTMQHALALAEGIPPANYYVMSLEALVRDPAAAVTRAFRFAGIEADDGVVAACCERIRGDGDHPDAWMSMLTEADAEMIDQACGPVYQQWQTRERDSQNWIDAATNAG